MAAETRAPNAFSIFRNRNFTLLWIAQFISEMGGGITAIAAGLLVYRETGTAASVGLVMVATMAPTLLVGLIAGVFVDRVDRQYIMIGAQIIRGLLIVSLPTLVDYGVIWLYLVVFLSAAVQQFFDPAQASVLPEIATDEELAAANSMMTVSTVGSTTIGFAVAGIIASRYEISWAFYFDAATFFLSAVLLWAMSVQKLEPVEDTSVRAVFGSLKEGMSFVRTTPIFRSLLTTLLVIGVAFGLFNALSLPFALEKLNASEFQYGLLEGAFSVGFVLGSMVMATFASRLHEGQWIALSYLLMGAVTLTVAGMNSVYIVGILYLVTGILNAPSYIGRSLIFQRNTTREIRGRVASINAVLRDLAFMAGMLLVFLGDVVDLRVAMIVAAALTLAGAGMAFVLPGLAQPTAEWRHTLSGLRAARTGPRLGLGRPATLADIDSLVGRVPVFGGLSAEDRQAIAKDSRIYEAPGGTAVVRTGETSTAAYFVLDGRTIASQEADGQDRVLEVHNAGDFFGEIAAIRNVPRTATVTTDEDSTLLEVPAETLRVMMRDPEMNAVFQDKLNERMLRLDLIELPRFAGLNQGTMREIRTNEPEPEAVPEPAAP
jgi:MFS transporter, DHA3 family, macrolide efflux protein